MNLIIINGSDRLKIYSEESYTDKRKFFTGNLETFIWYKFAKHFWMPKRLNKKRKSCQKIWVDIPECISNKKEKIFRKNSKRVQKN